jgi:hypothetical protein
VASGPDKAGAWPAPSDGGGSGKHDEKEYARNRCVKPPKMSHQLEPDGSGLGAVRACLTHGWATPDWLRRPVREATVKVCGVAVAMPRGYSRAPPSSSDDQ